MHISIFKFEVFMIFDGFVCFCSNSMRNLGRDGRTFSWNQLFCFKFFAFLNFVFVILLMIQENFFLTTVGSEFNKSEFFAILHATYRMDLFHMLHEFSFIQPGFTYDCRDNHFAIFVICLICSTLSETRYKHA